MTYIRYAESGRINWAQNFANHVDPKHKKEWSELWYVPFCSNPVRARNRKYVSAACRYSRPRKSTFAWSRCESDIFHRTPKGDGLILRSIKTDFKFPMAWPDRISVYHKLRAAPTASTDSFILDVLILSEKHQRPAARCVEDIVVYDYRRGAKSPLRDFMVDRFRETYALQEEGKRRNEAAVRGLLERVERLEKESWDREDAVEDMGSSR